MSRFRAVHFGLESHDIVPRPDTLYDPTRSSPISFCKLKSTLCTYIHADISRDHKLTHATVLILVDDSANTSQFDWGTGSMNKYSGGRILGLYDLTIAYFNGEWSRQLLISIDNTLHNEGYPHQIEPTGDGKAALGALCWLLSTATLTLVLGRISVWVNALADDVIKLPDLNLLFVLGTCRRTLHQLKFDEENRERVTLSAKRWALREHEEFAKNRKTIETSIAADWIKSWVDHRASVSAKIESLSASVNDSSQLLIGAMAVLDSATNNRQAERATMLTLLAAVYLPLTLATVIFGMNIREIDQGSPSWWWVIIVMAVLLTPSIIFVVYLFTKNRLERFRQQRAESRDNKMV
ncbi:hypothetical protein CBER1_02176 [Cercospora berteroae]|uniref:Uncharacterized protein n=1 Tax=Cercospora berteroae TaxID=357750 RepID=A0A2S6BQ76_9PEZI|nr:hypothetical protein CBER1_02176 [Cercospora berteroae]